ncbi:MAG: hypothetical protein ABI360_06755 [Allobranchiibius sp.]
MRLITTVVKPDDDAWPGTGPTEPAGQFARVARGYVEIVLRVSVKLELSQVVVLPVWER